MVNVTITVIMFVMIKVIMVQVIVITKIESQLMCLPARHNGKKKINKFSRFFFFVKEKVKPICKGKR